MNFFLTRALNQSGIPADALEGLESSISTQSLNAGEHLIHQGEEAPHLFFIKEGLVKMFYLTSDGKEFIKSFLPEGSFVGSLVSQIEHKESTFSVVCLEPVRVELAPFTALTSLFETNKEALAFGFRFFQALALKKEKREFSFLCLSPEERYLQFVEENPDLTRRLTQADIARYLGITPVALSRIRGRNKAGKTT